MSYSLLKSWDSMPPSFRAPMAYGGRQPLPCGLAMVLRIHLASPQGLCAWAKRAHTSSDSRDRCIVYYTLRCASRQHEHFLLSGGADLRCPAVWKPKRCTLKAAKQLCKSDGVSRILKTTSSKAVLIPCLRQNRITLAGTEAHAESKALAELHSCKPPPCEPQYERMAKTCKNAPSQKPFPQLQPLPMQVQGCKAERRCRRRIVAAE